VASFPPPPAVAELIAATRPEDVVAVAEHSALARIYRAAGAHPARWNDFREVGPVATARFDPHPPAPTPARHVSCAVLYCALQLQTCVAEVFQTARVLDRSTGRPHLAVWRPVRTLRVLDLSGAWPTRAGASQAIASGSRERARAWARAIRAALPDLDGLWYPSAMDGGSPALCLWAPARPSLPATPLANLPLDAAALAVPLGRIARTLRYRFG
jgi:hypothetical protein